MRKKVKHPARYFLPTLTWLILITVLLTLPGSAFPKANWLDKIWLDKWIHLGLFSLLQFNLTWSAYKFNNKQLRVNTLIWLAIGTVAYGIAMEFVQKYWVPNRSFDAGDIIADTAGTLLGAVYGWRRFIKK